MAYDKRMDHLPLFISYPRTGAHWINAVMELYFDRPRLRKKRVTFLDSGRTDWMWFHDHDHDLQIEHQDVLYLYRDPSATVYSNLVHQFLSKRPFWVRWVTRNYNIFCEREVFNFSEHYREHLLKWTYSPHKARTVICYDNFKTRRNPEFKKICEHFGVAFDEDRASHAFDIVTPEALSKKAGGNPVAKGKHLLRDSYKTGRNEFTERWGNTVKEIVMVRELTHLFPKS